jgi:hypothetical protein
MIDIPTHDDPRVTLILHIAYMRGELDDAAIAATLAVAVPLTSATTAPSAFTSVADWLDQAHAAHDSGDTLAEGELIESAVFHAVQMVNDELVAVPS